jgi:hypothetical protein|eukprot:COSAG02_NODE_1880_length_10551_cov_2.925947_11_plen_205_part_00
MRPRSRQLRSCGQGSGRRCLPALVAARSPYQTRQKTLRTACASAFVYAVDAQEVPERAREREQRWLVYSSAVALQALTSPGSRGNQFLLQDRQGENVNTGSVSVERNCDKPSPQASGGPHLLATACVPASRARFKSPTLIPDKSGPDAGAAGACCSAVELYSELAAAAAVAGVSASSTFFFFFFFFFFFALLLPAPVPSLPASC